MPALWAAQLAFATRAGYLGAGLIGIVAGIMSYYVLAVMFVTMRSPVLRLVVALIFAVPAAIAGYALVQGVPFGPGLLGRAAAGPDQGQLLAFGFGQGSHRSVRGGGDRRLDREAAIAHARGLFTSITKTGDAGKDAEVRALVAAAHGGVAFANWTFRFWALPGREPVQPFTAQVKVSDPMPAIS